MLSLDQRVKVEAQNNRSKRLKVYILEVSDSFVLTFSEGLQLGQLSEQVVRALKDVAHNKGFECDAFVDMTILRDKISKSKTLKDAAIRADLYLYGLHEHADIIGHVLSREKVFLQKPDHPRQGLKYSNPHYLDLPGLDISSDSVSLPQEMTTKLDFDEGEALNSGIAEVYASLQRGNRLDRNAGSCGLKTILLE
jgi:SWI/SNF-related matrix-associated actin-dependent regulator of chromatin subfamily A3